MWKKIMSILPKNSLERAEWVSFLTVLLLFVMVAVATCINRCQIKAKILIVEKKDLLVICPA